MKQSAFCGALLLLGASAAVSTAQAAQSTDCSATLAIDNLALNPGYTECQPMSGPGVPAIFDLNPVGSLPKDVEALNSFFSIDTYERKGVSSLTSSGPFVTNPFGLNSGVLQLVTPLSGYFVIGLQAIDPLGASTNPPGPLQKVLFYEFSYPVLSPATSIFFDTRGFNNPGPALEAVALYLPTAAIPEPASWIMVLLGLGLMGAVKGRSRN